MKYWVHHGVVAVFFLAAYVGVNMEIPSEILTGIIAFSNLAVLVALERILPRRQDSDLFHDRQAPNDLGHFAVTSALRYGAQSYCILSLMSYAPSDGIIASWPSHWPFVAQFFGGVFVWELVSYPRHRMLHAVQLLWPIHELHHDTRHFHTLKAVRTHFLDDMTSIPFDFLVPFLLGAPKEMYFWVFLWDMLFGNLIHANIDQRNPWWLHYIIPTVQLHEGHHSRGSMYKNLAGSLPLIDILFGTYEHPSRMDVSRLGLAEEIPPGFASQLARPFKLMVRGQPAP